MAFSIKGKMVDVHQKKIYAAEIFVSNERITDIKSVPLEENMPFILPGFIDAHVHIESSMLIPSEFARLAVVHGTVATVSDPHEIANVCGIEGVEFMIENGNSVPFKFYFGAPSCVPATFFETSGATINTDGIEYLLKKQDILYLAEMMNFPAVLQHNEDVLKKISLAKKYNKPIDGHAPGLRGESAKNYISSGISTDHECFSMDEALDKLKYGMKIIIREGSAAKNFNTLIDLLNDYPNQMMFCSDDKHPDSLVKGHINDLCSRAVKKGIDIFKVLQAACVNPVSHYKLKVGLLRKNDFADFIIVNDLENFNILKTYINGNLVSEKGTSLIKTKQDSIHPINNFHCSKKTVMDFKLPASNNNNQFIIEALDGQLITNKLNSAVLIKNNYLESNTEKDILKIVVVNRYSNAPVAVSFIKNFGLKNGAIASSVAHDSHNIVAVGTDDISICKTVNSIIENKGGISWIGSETEEPLILKLPVGGLMSMQDGYKVASEYQFLDLAAKNSGSTLTSPFMTLSFMALLVIPHLKLSDQGLFDVDTFELQKRN